MKAQIQTEKGGRLLSANRVKANALKAWQKDNPITAQGNKAEFQHAVNKMSVDVKAQTKPIIDNLFANGKTPTPEALKRGWKDLHEIEARAHEAKGETSAAKAAREQAVDKGKLIDKFVKTNKVAAQHEELSNAMKDSIKKAHDLLPDEAIKLSDAQQQEFIDTQIEKAFKKNNHEPLSKLQLDQLKDKLIKQAETHANEHSARSAVENEEILGDEAGLTDEAKKAFEESGKLSDDAKQHIEDHIISQTEKAFADGDITKMRDQLDTVISHYFRKDSARVHTLTKFVETVDKAQRYQALYPHNPELWLTRTEVNNLGKAGNTHAGNMKSKIVDMIQGKNYADQKVVSSMLTNAERAQRVAEIEANRKASTRKGALTPNKPRLIRRNGKWVRKD